MMVAKILLHAYNKKNTQETWNTVMFYVKSLIFVSYFSKNILKLTRALPSSVEPEEWKCFWY